jgi:hypothetical protein
VTSLDTGIANASQGTIVRINIPAAGPFAPSGADEGDGDGGGSAIASALAARTSADQSPSSAPAVLVDRPHAVVDPTRPQAPPPADSSGETPRLKPSASDDSLAADLALDDELLDSLLERF